MNKLSGTSKVPMSEAHCKFIFGAIGITHNFAKMRRLQQKTNYFGDGTRFGNSKIKRNNISENKTSS